MSDDDVKKERPTEWARFSGWDSPMQSQIEPIGKIIAATINEVDHRFRRYALLQAATLILYSPEFRYSQHKTPYLAAIDYAEEMLAEIERREK